MKKTNWETKDVSTNSTNLPNDNEDFFNLFFKGLKITKTAIISQFESFEEFNDLHFEEYGADEDFGPQIGEQFITIWKDTGNSSIGYKGKCKVSLVLVESVDTKNYDPIEIYECIFII